MKKYIKKIIISFANLGAFSSMIAIVSVPTQHQSINTNKEKNKPTSYKFTKMGQFKKGAWDRLYKVYIDSKNVDAFSTFENGKDHYPPTSVLKYIDDYMLPGWHFKSTMQKHNDWNSFLAVTAGDNPYTYGTRFNFNEFKSCLAKKAKIGEALNIYFSVKYYFLAHDNYNISYW